MSARNKRQTVLLAVGFAALAVAALGIVTEPKVGWGALLSAALFALTLSLGAALLIGINVMTAARWWIPVIPAHTRLARLVIVPIIAIAVVLVVGMGSIYPWTDPDVIAHNQLLQDKAPWLNRPFVLARAALILGVWLVIVKSLCERVEANAAQPNAANRGRMGAVGILFLVIFAVTISVSSWDWTLSLEPEYFSTMAGVYGFAGVFVGGIVAVTLAAEYLAARGELPGYGDAQRHDLAKLLFAFSFFWAYIWFCQYMLTWYANIPEEAGYFVHRIQGGWAHVFILNAILNFGLPFAILLSAGAKKRRSTLLLACGIIVIGRFVDAWLMVAPSLSDTPAFPTYAVCGSLGLVCLMIALGLRKPSTRAPAPLETVPT